MPENNDSNNGDAIKGDKNEKVSHAGLWLIIIAGLLLLGVLIIIGSFYVNEHSERIRFVTVNALSLLLLIIIAVQAYIYKRQWEAMQGQLEETRELRKISERQAEALDNQAGTFENQAGVMQGQLDVMRQTIAENQRVFYVGERAYIAISHIQFVVNPKEGQKPAIQMIIINGGRTPAWDVRMHVRISVEDPTNDKSRDYLKTASHTETRGIARIIIPKQTEFIITVTARFVISHEMEMEVYSLSGFFVRGEIYFRDISEEEQILPFCFIWQAKVGVFEDCKRNKEQPNTKNPN